MTLTARTASTPRPPNTTPSYRRSSPRTRLDFLPLAERVERAKADSLWQLVVLQGAVGESARADVLAYAAPTYYGMLVAEVTA